MSLYSDLTNVLTPYAKKIKTNLNWMNRIANSGISDEVSLRNGTLMIGYYPSNNAGISTSSTAARMMVYPVEPGKTYYITWLPNTTAHPQARTAFGDTAPEDIVNGTIVYDYYDNKANNKLTRYAKTNSGNHSYLYVYIATDSDGTPDIVEVTTTSHSFDKSVSALNSIEKITDDIENARETFTLVENDGYLNVDGSIHEQTYTNEEKYTDLIPVNGSELLVFDYTLETSKSMWLCYCAYDANNNLIGQRVNVLNNSAGAVHDAGSFIIPSNARGIKLTYRTHGYSNVMKVFAINHASITQLRADMDEYASIAQTATETALQTAIDAVKKIQDEITLTEYDGYLDSTGNVMTPSEVNGEKYTNLIPITDDAENLNWYYELQNKDTMWLAYIPYDVNGDRLQNRTNIYSLGTGGTKASGVFNVPSGTTGIKFTYRAHGETGVVKLFSVNNNVTENLKEGIANNAVKSNLAVFPARFKPCYDHLFVSRKNDNCIIPHESLYHVRLSRKLGFNIIEANVAYTSDGVYFVNHLSSRKFDGYFHHIDGNTDISDINVNTVTWNWIEENVRYNSSIPKYRTRPCRLDEFLGECRQQNIVPFITSKTGSNNYLEIADKYMGKGNYIAYGATRDIAPNAIIYHYKSDLSTKEDILAYCKKIGAPFIYGLSNTGSFTDAQLKELCDLLHENGFWIGVSYKDVDWYKYSYLGFDFNATQTGMNRIDNGNICNFDTIFGFDDFDYTNATETDAILTCSANATIRPKIQDTVYSVCGIDLEVSFNGSITLSRMGEMISNYVYESDGSYPMFITVPIFNGHPKFTLTATNGTVIYDMKFKASRF